MDNMHKLQWDPMAYKQYLSDIMARGSIMLNDGHGKTVKQQLFYKSDLYGLIAKRLHVTEQSVSKWQSPRSNGPDRYREAVAGMGETNYSLLLKLLLGKAPEDTLSNEELLFLKEPEAPEEKEPVFLYEFEFQPDGILRLKNTGTVPLAVDYTRWGSSYTVIRNSGEWVGFLPSEDIESIYPA